MTLHMTLVPLQDATTVRVCKHWVIQSGCMTLSGCVESLCCMVWTAGLSVLSLTQPCAALGHRTGNSRQQGLHAAAAALQTPPAALAASPTLHKPCLVVCQLDAWALSLQLLLVKLS